MKSSNLLATRGEFIFRKWERKVKYLGGKKDDIFDRKLWSNGNNIAKRVSMSSLSRLRSRVLFIAIAFRAPGLINISDMQITGAIGFSLNEPPLVFSIKQFYLIYLFSPIFLDLLYFFFFFFFITAKYKNIRKIFRHESYEKRLGRLNGSLID